MAVGLFGHKRFLRYLRIRDSSRGRRLKKGKSQIASERTSVGAIRFGNDLLPGRTATQHFLATGTTGSGKSNVQRLGLAAPLRTIHEGSDSRALIFDAKGETTAFLRRIGANAPIYSLNPFESRSEHPIAVAWDTGKDITSPLRANNLSRSLITGEASGANGYFVKAARAVVAGCMKSFIRHAATDWTFADLVYATTSWERIRELLGRDEMGEQLVQMFLAENNTGYGVATTVAADMDLYAPVAALWQRSPRKLSIREWLTGSSILLLGENETASATLDVLNQQMFTVFVEEVLVQTNSSTRRTYLWIDEAQEARSILRSGRVQSFAAKARSKGGSLWIAFQDVEGFRVAAGDQKVADSIIAQCSHKAILRQASFESARWAADLLGQYETIVVYHSDSRDWKHADPGSEQRVVSDAVLPSEFYDIPETNPQNGLTGYFVSSDFGARRVTIPARDIAEVAVSDKEEREHAIIYRNESDQWIRKWTFNDKVRLGLAENFRQTREAKAEPAEQVTARLKLRKQTLATMQLPRQVAE